MVPEWLTTAESLAQSEFQRATAAGQETLQQRHEDVVSITRELDALELAAADEDAATDAAVAAVVAARKQAEKDRWRLTPVPDDALARFRQVCQAPASKDKQPVVEFDK